MKLRAEMLGLKEPQDWEMDGQDGKKRKGQTFKVSLLLENADTVLLKITEDFYKALSGAKLSRFAVIDVLFEPRVVLDLNRNGRPEQLLKIVPVGFEWVANRMEDLQVPKVKAS